MIKTNECLERIKGNFGLLLCFAYDGPSKKINFEQNLQQKIQERIENLHSACHDCEHFFKICCGVTTGWVEARKNKGQLADPPSCRKIETFESSKVT